MPLRRIVIIIISVILLAIFVAGGVFMFRNLNRSRIAHSSDINIFLPGDAPQLMRVNTQQGLSNIAPYDRYTASVAEPLKKYIGFPFYVALYKHAGLMVAKINPQEEDAIKDVILRNITASPYAKERRMGDADVLFYSLPEGRFLACTFYQGILGISEDYKLIEKMLDTTRVSFFDDKPADELLSRIKGTFPSYTIVRNGGQTTVAGMNVYPDSVVFEGYIVPSERNGEVVLPPVVAPINIAASEYVSADTIRRRNDVFLKIKLNKVP